MAPKPKLSTSWRDFYLGGDEEIMRVSSHRSFWSLLLIIVFLASCSQAPRILFNATDDEVLVKSDGNLHKASGKSFIDFEWPSSQEIIIESLHGARKYRMAVPPPEYMPVISGKREIFCQLESSGWIYVLKPRETYPAPELSAQLQPPGFPLRPDYE